MSDAYQSAFADSGFGAAEQPTATPVHPLFAAPPKTALAGDMMLRVLDEMGNGLIVVDAERRICFANHLARFELSTQLALRGTGQTLTTAIAAQAAKLAEAVRMAQLGQRSMVQVGTPEQLLALSVMPLNHRFEVAPIRVLVVCAKRQACDSLTLQFYARACKLSACEELVLKGLCSGLDTEGIAAANKVQASTVRSQILKIREKTGATSVRDLLQRTAALPAMVPTVRAAAPHSAEMAAL